MKLANKYIKTAIIIMFNIYYNLKANMDIIRRVKYIKMNHMKYLRIKTNM